MTRAELMRHALSQALRRVHVGPKKLKLDEETALADRWRGRRRAAPLRRLERVRRGSSDETVGERLNTAVCDWSQSRIIQSTSAIVSKYSGELSLSVFKWRGPDKRADPHVPSLQRRFAVLCNSSRSCFNRLVLFLS